MTKKLRNIEPAWSDLFLKIKRRVLQNIIQKKVDQFKDSISVENVIRDRWLVKYHYVYIPKISPKIRSVICVNEYKA